MTIESTSTQTPIGLRPHAVARVTNAGLTMLFDRAKGVMYELNETASVVVKLLADRPRTLDELVEELCGEFDGPRDEITADVRSFIDDFSDAGLLAVGE
ncbi:PqqD family protein [Nocardia nova]|uniref:PqqD family protein n=1 Tax=Nocardia nova TaxID=37330 RepID=UPI0033C6DE94